MKNTLQNTARRDFLVKSAATTGALHWSRYLGRDTLAIDWLENLQCE